MPFLEPRNLVQWGVGFFLPQRDVLTTQLLPAHLHHVTTPLGSVEQHVDRVLIGKDGQIEVTTKPAVMIPLHPDLAEVLASASRSHLTLLTTERGAPFTSAGFGNWFRDRCNEAGLPQCSAHGLRKAAATRLANAGCSSDQIRAITGHRSLAEVAHYTKAADQQRLARQAMEMQIGAEREQGLSSPSSRLDKTGRK